MSRVSIVVPVFHNETSVEPLLSELQLLAANNPTDEFEFIFVDDGSRDRSLSKLESLAATETRMRVVKLSRNFGSNAAITAGLSLAKGDVVGAIAADLQDPPSVFNEMLVRWRAGNRAVIAARADRSDPPLTIFFASLFYRLFRRFALPAMPANGFDLFLIDRKIADIITSIQENNVYLMGLILWLGFEPAVVSYDRRAREARFGRSMWTITRKLKYFVDAFVAFSHFPVRAASLLGLAISTLGASYALFLVILHFTFRQEVAGWTSLMVVLLIVSGAQLITLGIIGEYLVRTLDETRKRPRFIIDRVIGGASRIDGA